MTMLQRPTQRTAPLTRAEMVEIIRRGESVSIAGHIYNSEAGLPSEAQLAVGDPAAEAAAERDLHSKIDALTAQLGALKSGSLPSLRESAAPGELATPATAVDAGNDPTVHDVDKAAAKAAAKAEQDRVAGQKAQSDALAAQAAEAKAANPPGPTPGEAAEARKALLSGLNDPAVGPDAGNAPAGSQGAQKGKSGGKPGDR